MNWIPKPSRGFSRLDFHSFQIESNRTVLGNNLPAECTIQTTLETNLGATRFVNEIQDHLLENDRRETS